MGSPEALSSALPHEKASYQAESVQCPPKNCAELFVDLLRNSAKQNIAGLHELGEFFIDFTEMATSQLRSGDDIPRPTIPAELILIPGYKTMAYTLSQPRAYFKRIGHNPTYGLVTGPMRMQMNQYDEIKEAILRSVSISGRSSKVIGQSAGGMFGFIAARELNERWQNGEFPHLVAQPVDSVYTLGSPIAPNLFDETIVPESALRVRALAEHDMRSDPRAAELQALNRYIFEEIPENLKVTSFVNERDRVVPWQFSTRDDAKTIYIDNAHTGMGNSVKVWNHIAWDLHNQEKEYQLRQAA